MPQLEPGHRPPTAPTPPPPCREARDELEPAAAFRIAASRPQLRQPGTAPVGDFDPDNAVPGTDRDRDRLAGSTRPAMPDTVAEQLAHEQCGVITARVPRAEHETYERAGEPRPLRPPGKRHALPHRQPSHQRTRLPGRLHPGNRRGSQADTRDARSTQRRTSSRDTPARTARPWPSVESRRCAPTVLVARTPVRLPASPRDRKWFLDGLFTVQGRASLCPVALIAAGSCERAAGSGAMGANQGPGWFRAGVGPFCWGRE